MSRLVQRGIEAVHRQDPHGALTWFERAVASDAGDAVARAWAGQTLCHIGRRIDGIAHLAAAATMLLDAPPAGHDKLFEVLLQLQSWGAFEHALPLARTLARRPPDHARAQHLLAVTCGQINLTDEALAAVDRAHALAPDDAMTEVLHASLEADAKRYAAAADRLDSLLERLASAGSRPGADAVGIARAMFRGLKEMARVLDALGEHDAVFPQIDAAAQLTPMLPEYTRLDPRQLPDYIAANAADFDGATMRRFTGRSFAGQPRAPAFVLGFFRSGTTLVQEVLRAHPDVFLSDEVGLLHAVVRALHRLRPGPGNVLVKLAGLDEVGVAQLRSAYWTAARDHHGPACDHGVFVDKFTLNTVDLALVNTVFPDACVVFVMRDPRDVCLSSVMQLMVPSPATVHLLRLSDTAALYAQVMRWWLQVRGHLSLRWRVIRYEDAVADLEATFRPVFELLGLDWRAEVTAFHRRAVGRYVASPSRNQVAQPLYRSSVARWRRYEAEMAPLRETLAPFVDRFGYPAG